MDTEAVEDLRDIPRITLYIKYVYTWVYDVIFVYCVQNTVMIDVPKRYEFRLRVS